MKFNTFRRFYHSCTVQGVTPADIRKPGSHPTYGPPESFPCALVDAGGGRPTLYFRPNVNLPNEARITNIRDRDGRPIYVHNLDTGAEVVWRVSGIEAHTNPFGHLEYRAYKLVAIS